MYTIKDLCGWYNVSPNTMRSKLIEIGVIEKDRGKGNQKRLEYRMLKPVFDRLGMPKSLTLTDPQLKLFE
jgi:hypothetical protein